MKEYYKKMDELMAYIDKKMELLSKEAETLLQDLIN